MSDRYSKDFVKSFTGWLKSETFENAANGKNRRKIIEYSHYIREKAILQKKMDSIKKKVDANAAPSSSQAAGSSVQQELSSTDSSDPDELSRARAVPDGQKLSKNEIQSLIVHEVGMISKFLPFVSDIDQEMFKTCLLAAADAPEILRREVLQ